MVASERLKWFALALLCIDAVRRRARHRRRQRRPSVDPERPRLLAGEPAVGDQRLRTRLRRLHAARRSPGRHPRAQARVHGRPRHLLGGLSSLWPGLERGVAHRRPRPPGSRGGDDHAFRALDPDQVVHRGPRAQHRPRRLGRGRRCRRRRRRPHGRGPHGSPLLAVDLLRQRPGRHRRACRLPGPAAREQGRGGAEPRHPGRRARDLGARPARPRNHPGTLWGGARPGRSASSPSRRLSSEPSRSGSSDSGSRSFPSRSSSSRR